MFRIYKAINFIVDCCFVGKFIFYFISLLSYFIAQMSSVATKCVSDFHNRYTSNLSYFWLFILELSEMYRMWFFFTNAIYCCHCLLNIFCINLINKMRKE